MNASVMARLGEGVAWVVLCLAVWVSTLSSITRPELVVGGSAALLSAVAAVGGRVLARGRWTIRPSWLNWFWQLVLTAPVETAAVLWSALRAEQGRTTKMTLPQRERAHVSASRRGLGTLLVSASPGSYVVEEELEQRRLEIHRLGHAAPTTIQVGTDAR